MDEKMKKIIGIVAQVGGGLVALALVFPYLKSRYDMIDSIWMIVGDKRHTIPALGVVFLIAVIGVDVCLSKKIVDKMYSNLVCLGLAVLNFIFMLIETISTIVALDDYIIGRVYKPGISFWLLILGSIVMMGAAVTNTVMRFKSGEMKFPGEN